MKAITYYHLVKQELPRVTPAKAVTLLAPISSLYPFTALQSESFIKQLPDNGVAYLENLDELVDWEAVEERFAPLEMLVNAAKTVATGVTTGMVGMFSMQALTNKDLYEGSVTELSRLKHPSMFLKSNIGLFNGSMYPFQEEEINLRMIQKLLDEQVGYVKGFKSFLNASRYHAATAPDVDVTTWVKGLKSIGGDLSNKEYRSERLFGNIQLVVSKTNNGWVPKVEELKNLKAPKRVNIPPPLALGIHLRNAKRLLTEMWALDSELSKALNDIYDISTKGDRMVIKDVKLIQRTTNLFYTALQGSTLELALSYAKTCEALTGKFLGEQYAVIKSSR